MTRMRDWLLEELQPSSAISHTTKDGSAYDATLHSSMQSFWDLFDKGEYVQQLTCKKCNTTFEETKEAFSEVVLQLPPSHQEGEQQTCTLDELIRRHNETAECEDYQCTICNTRTIARSARRISQYPKIMCIVLSRWGQDDTRNDLAVTYPLQGLFGSVHHNMNRGKSGHYTAICKSPDPDNWILYDDDTVRREQFVTKGKNGKVKRKFMKSASILFYNDFTADPVRSNNLHEHNENDETQEDVEADAKQGQNKSTNETAQAASIDIQTQNDSSNDPGPPKSRCCDWAMGSFSQTGRDTPHQERCISEGVRMKTCTMEGCSTMVHTLCHNNWLDAHCYLRAPPGQHVCRQHSNSYCLWVRLRAGKIQRSQNGCIPGSAAATK